MDEGTAATTVDVDDVIPLVVAEPEGACFFFFDLFFFFLEVTELLVAPAAEASEAVGNLVYTQLKMNTSD